MKPHFRLEHARDAYPVETMRAFKKSGLWTDSVATDFLDRNALRLPDGIAVVDGECRVTWAQLRDRVDRVAGSLLASGLRPSDFICIQLPNQVEYVEVFLAAVRAGLRVLSVMSIYREKDLLHMLSQVGARALVVPAQHRGHDFVSMAAALVPQVDTLDHVIIVGEPAAGMLRYEDLRTAPLPSRGALRALRPDPDALSKVTYTSGTTGLPKGVVHTHNTDLVPPKFIVDALGLDQDSAIWMPSPIAHATGLLFGPYTSLLTGAPLILQDAWDPHHALELIARERAVFTVGATPFISGLLDAIRTVSPPDLSSFRYFVSGGAPVSPTLVDAAKRELGVDLLRVFGQSEAPLHTLNHPQDPWEKRTGTDGRALPGVDVRIVDPADRSLVRPVGEIGEYSTRGPHVFLGYWDAPDETAGARSGDGWYYSGDLCRMDEDGHVLYIDRMKDIINRGGVKISALEVENTLVAHPWVSAAAVVAIPDHKLGERIGAFVVPARGVDGLELDDVTAFLEEQGVTRQKWPERLVAVDSLPTTATGKVQKGQLRHRFEALSTESS
jgi:cyclohexanecarboxylate-CoA ligase/acyl-CoA synthetase